MNLFKKLLSQWHTVFRRRIRRRWRRHEFLNRRLLDWHGPLPLPPGKYRFQYEWWTVWGPPKIKETATAYMLYVRKNGRITRQRETIVEIEPD